MRLAHIVIVLAVLEIIITCLNSDALKKGRKRIALSLFIAAAAIGVGLTVSAVVRLHGRTTVISPYRIWATVLVISFEVSVVLSEFTPFLSFIKQHRRHEEEQNGGNFEDPSPVEVWQRSERSNATEAVRRSWSPSSDIWLTGFMSLFYFSLFIGCTLYIVFARVGQPREGDFGVELVTLISYGLAEFTLLSIQGKLSKKNNMELPHDQRGDIRLFRSLQGFYIIPGSALLIAGTVATSKRRIYVDSGVISMASVLIPGSFGLAMHYRNCQLALVQTTDE